jgi:hypothetical protein
MVTYMNKEYSKPIKRLIREWNETAYERELHRELSHLGAQFDRWRDHEIDSFELNNHIHKFHNGISRKLWQRYNSSTSVMDFNVAYALVAGILSEDEVPSELRDVLGNIIQMYRDMKDKNELRMPGE